MPPVYTVRPLWMIPPERLRPPFAAEQPWSMFQLPLAFPWGDRDVIILGEKHSAWGWNEHILKIVCHLRINFRRSVVRVEFPTEDHIDFPTKIILAVVFFLYMWCIVWTIFSCLSVYLCKYPELSPWLLYFDMPSPYWAFKEIKIQDLVPRSPPFLYFFLALTSRHATLEEERNDWFQ